MRRAGDPSWSGGLGADTGQGDDTAFAPDGSAVYAAEDGTGDGVSAPWRPPGGPFAGGETVTSGIAGGLDAGSLRVAMSPTGEATPLWSEDTGKRIMVSTRGPGASGTWSAPRQVNADEGAGSTFMGCDETAPAAGPDGRAVALWTRLVPEPPLSGQWDGCAIEAAWRGPGATTFGTRGTVRTVEHGMVRYMRAAMGDGRAAVAFIEDVVPAGGAGTQSYAGRARDPARSPSTASACATR